MPGDLPPSDSDVDDDLPSDDDPNVVEGMRRLAKMRASEGDVPDLTR